MNYEEKVEYDRLMDTAKQCANEAMRIEEELDEVRGRGRMAQVQAHSIRKAAEEREAVDRLLLDQSLAELCSRAPAIGRQP